MTISQVNGRSFAGSLVQFLKNTFSLAESSSVNGCLCSTGLISPSDLSFFYEGSEHFVRFIERLVRGDLVRGDLVRGDLVRGDLVRGDLVRGDLVRGDLVRGDLVRGDLVRGDLVRGDLVRGDLVRGDLVRGDLVRGDLVRGDFNTSLQHSQLPLYCISEGHQARF